MMELLAVLATVMVVLYLKAEVVARIVLIRTIRLPYLVSFDHSRFLFDLLLLLLIQISSCIIIFAVSVQFHSLQTVCFDQSCQVV